MNRRFLYALISLQLLLSACGQGGHKHDRPRIGFLDLVADETLGEARKGFFVALKDQGFENEKNLEILYRNAQGDQPTLAQACSYLISQEVDLIATCPTLSTIAAVQQTQTIPVFMMVTPRPDLAGLEKNGKAPSNLLGVYESLEYIDTSVLLLRLVMPGLKKLGTLYNPSEPQSALALDRIRKRCAETGIELVVMPVSNSNETQLVTAAILGKKVDAFFALPDNVVFAAMEIIVKTCDDARVPVFTSEEGLVRRGAVAGFGADMYQWGYQCGQQAAAFLSGKKNLSPEPVSIRRRVYNAKKAEAFQLSFDSSYTAIH